ncbi:hypothetical protein D3C78_1517530 [compost metagenome]
MHFEPVADAGGGAEVQAQPDRHHRLWRFLGERHGIAETDVGERAKQPAVRCSAVVAMLVFDPQRDHQPLLRIASKVERSEQVEQRTAAKQRLESLGHVHAAPTVAIVARVTATCFSCPCSSCWRVMREVGFMKAISVSI